MPGAAKVSAAAAGVLLVGLVWVSSADVALRYPESYFLPDRTRNVGVLLGWSAGYCCFTALASRRGLLRSRWWSSVALATLLVCTAVVGWLVRADGRDYPRVNFAFVAGSGVDRLLVLGVVGLAVPLTLAVAAYVVLVRTAIRSGKR